MRHYSNGRLVALECDKCGKLIAPNPRISESGWVKCGMLNEHGTRFEYDYCDRHADIADRFVAANQPKQRARR